MRPQATATTGVRIVLWLSILMVGLTCGEATAQPVSKEEDSIEWMAADSKRIVRATIEKIEIVHKGSCLVCRAITLRVKETLKGKHADSLCLVNRGFGQHSAEEWKKRQCDVLFFLNDGRFHVDRWDTGYVLTRFPLVVRNAIELSPGKVAVHSRNLKLITDPKELVSAVTAVLRDLTHQGQIPSFQIDLPKSHREKGSLRFPGGYTSITVTVPVDQDLERLAKAWMDSDELRRTGTQAQELFQSRLDFESFAVKHQTDPATEPTRRWSRRDAGYVGVDSLEQMAVDWKAPVLPAGSRE